MKLLNLDDIAVNSERQVKYRDQMYAVRDFNVEEFIKFQKAFKLFVDASNSTEEGSIEKMVDSAKKVIALGVPEFPEAEVSNLNPAQLMMLVSMVANLLPEMEIEDDKADGDAKEVSDEKKAEAVTAE